MLDNGKKICKGGYMKKLKIFSLSLVALFLMLFSFVIFPAQVYAGGGGGAVGGGGGDQPTLPTEFVQYKNLTTLNGKITEINFVDGTFKVHVYSDPECVESLGIFDFDVFYLYGILGENKDKFELLYQVDYSIIWLPDNDCWVVDFYNPSGMQIWALDEARAEFVSSTETSVNMNIYIGGYILLSPSTYAFADDRISEDVVIDNLTSESNLIFSADSNMFSIQSNEFTANGTADEWFSHISQFNYGVARGEVSHPADWGEAFIISVEEEPSHQFEGFTYQYDGRYFGGNEDLIYFETRLHPVIESWAYDRFEYDFATVLQDELGQTNFDGFLYWNFEEQYWQIEYYISSEFEPVFEGETAFVTNVDNPMSVENILSHIRLIDNEDGDITSYIIVENDGYTANRNKTGTYQIYISGQDSAGNIAELTIHVLVKDVAAPIITSPMGDSIELSYTEKAVINQYIQYLNVTDNYDNVAPVIVIEEDNYSDNYDTLGSYDILFSATDKSGNTGYYTITAYVIDDVKPTFSGPTSIMKGQNEILTLQDIKDQITCVDYIDGNLTLSVVEDNYTGNGSKVGSYTIIFEATDNNANTATHTVNVTVSDDIPPIFYVDNYFITVEQSLVLTKEDIIAILTASGQLQITEVTTLKFLLNEYEGHENVPGVYGMVLNVASADGSGEQISLVVKVVEDDEATVIEPKDTWLEKAWNYVLNAWEWMVSPVKSGSKFYNGYFVIIGIVVSAALIVSVIKKSKKGGRRRW